LRKEFSRKVKFQAFKRCLIDGKPHCEKCGVLLRAGDLHYDHIIPDGLGGEPTLENCQVICIKLCHNKKTHQEDNPVMQKADRVLKKTFSIATRKGRPIPGSKASGFKKKFDGSVIRRDK
jgi:5-methylcytosine-specific restriction enzyme A